jgi:hypothetical protein
LNFGFLPSSHRPNTAIPAHGGRRTPLNSAVIAFGLLGVQPVQKRSSLTRIEKD